MVNEKARSSFSNSCLTSTSSSRSSFVLLKNEELYQELDELLSAFCSEAQQQFCIDQEILSVDDLKRMQHTVQQIQSLLSTITTNKNGLPLQRTLVRVIQEILNCYGEACHKRNMRLLDDLSTNQSIGEWHQLKQQWEQKSKENQRLLLILDDITLLTRSWNQQNKDSNTNDDSYKHMVLLPSLSSLPHRLSSATKRVSSTTKHSKSITATTITTASTTINNRDILSASTSLFSFSPSSPSPSSSLSTAEDILVSLLTTFAYPPGAYTVVIDKHNYRQLGLQQGKIGTRQIIFDGYQLSTSDMIAMINRLCDLFASSFASTAQQHLAQIDSQMKKAQPFYMLTQSMKKLSAQISNTTWTNIEEEQWKNLYINKEINDCDNSRTSSPITNNATNNNSSPHIQRSTATTTSMSILSPFRLTHSTSQMPWNNPILPIPSFAPAPWQMPDLLKPRHPYNPVFFGLIRRKTHINMDSSISTPRNSSSSSSSRNSNRSTYTTTTTTTTSNNNNNNNNNNSNSNRYNQSSFLKHAQQYETTVQRTPSVQQARKIGHQTSNTAPRNFSNNKYATNIPAHHNDRHTSSGTINDSIDNSFSPDPSYSSPIQSRSSFSTVSPLNQHSSVSFNKTRRSPVSSTTSIKDHHHISGGYSHHHLNDYNNINEDDEDPIINRMTVASNPMAPFTSVSVNKLSFYLGKIAGQFYQDLLMHTRLRYQETQDALQEIESQMMDLYRHLQLASSRAVMHRAMMIVQELDERHQQQKQQEEYHHRYPPLSTSTLPHNTHTVYLYHPDQKCDANDFAEEDEESSSSSSGSSNDTSDSDSYEHNQQQAKKATPGRWRPICIDTYRQQRNSPPSPIIRQDSKLYRKGISTAINQK